MEEKRPGKTVNNLNESFQDFINRMDRLLMERPSRGLLQSIDEFFQNSKPLGGFFVDLNETDNDYIIQAQLPGIKKEQITIEIFPTYVTISVKHEYSMTQQDKDLAAYKMNQTRQEAMRRISLPRPIHDHKAKASYKDGLLTIKLPKIKGKKLNLN